jgi:hypothetical protein
MPEQQERLIPSPQLSPARPHPKQMPGGGSAVRMKPHMPRQQSARLVQCEIKSSKGMQAGAVVPPSLIAPPSPGAGAPGVSPAGSFRPASPPQPTNNRNMPQRRARLHAEPPPQMAWLPTAVAEKPKKKGSQHHYGVSCKARAAPFGSGGEGDPRAPRPRTKPRTNVPRSSSIRRCCPPRPPTARFLQGARRLVRSDEVQARPRRLAAPRW